MTATDLYNYTSPNGGSLRKAIAGLVSLAYPIERTGVGRGSVRMVTWGDGSTVPAQPRQQRVGRRLLRQQAQHLSRAAEPLSHRRDRVPRLERPAVRLPAGAQSPPRRAARLVRVPARLAVAGRNAAAGNAPGGHAQCRLSADGHRPAPLRRVAGLLDLRRAGGRPANGPQLRARPPRQARAHALGPRPIALPGLERPAVRAHGIRLDPQRLGPQHAGRQRVESPGGQFHRAARFQRRRQVPRHRQPRDLPGRGRDAGPAADGRVPLGLVLGRFAARANLRLVRPRAGAAEPAGA